MQALLLALFLCLAGSAVATPGEVPVGGTLREAQLLGLGGTSARLSQFRGTPLIINVWASWCPPCREEMGSLERLSRRSNGRRFRVIGISTDDYPEDALAALRQARLSFPNFIDRNLLLENMLGADRLPLTLLVDGQGRVLARFYGGREWDSPEALQVIRRYFGLKL